VLSGHSVKNEDAHMSVASVLRMNSDMVLDPGVSSFSPMTAADYTAMKLNPVSSDDPEQAYLDAFVLGGRILYRLILLLAACLYLFNQFFGHIQLVD
jgi:hypothetical protein